MFCLAVQLSKSVWKSWKTFEMVQSRCIYIVVVRLCLPFPCVSTPLYGPSCFLSLVNSSPSVFDLLLTWCCFPWLLWVHKPWVFPESLSVNSSMWLCILCSVIKFPLFLLPLVSRVLPAARPWQIDGPQKRWRSAAAARSWSWSAVRGVLSMPPAARPARHSREVSGRSRLM